MLQALNPKRDHPKRDDGDASPSGSEAESVDDIEEPERVIRCAECGHVLTKSEHRFTMNGRHEHVFTNPHGYVFHISCFRTAPGAGAVGGESDEWAWFSGWNWQTAICRGCLTHIGWRFLQGEDEFWGLIAAKLDD